MRFTSFQVFWPYYLQEHRQLTCRITHFIGSNIFFGLLGWRLYHTGLPLIAAFAAVVLLCGACFAQEAKWNTAPVLMASIGGLIVVDPVMFFVILPAYSFAWTGHFFIEKNRPATFQYPLWSLVGDLRMCMLMWRGQLWRAQSTSSTKPSMRA